MLSLLDICHNHLVDRVLKGELDIYDLKNILSFSIWNNLEDKCCIKTITNTTNSKYVTETKKYMKEDKFHRKYDRPSLIERIYCLDKIICTTYKWISGHKEYRENKLPTEIITNSKDIIIYVKWPRYCFHRPTEITVEKCRTLNRTGDGKYMELKWISKGKIHRDLDMPAVITYSISDDGEVYLVQLDWLIKSKLKRIYPGAPRSITYNKNGTLKNIDDISASNKSNEFIIRHVKEMYDMYKMEYTKYIGYFF